MKIERKIFKLQCEPRNRGSREDHRTRLIEYDDRMRQEEKKYARLLIELNNSRWLERSNPSKNDRLNAVQTEDLEATRLTEDEILHGCGLTMEQALLNRRKSCMTPDNGSFNRTNTQNAIAFQCTLSLYEGSNSRNLMSGRMHCARNGVIEQRKEESLWRSVIIVSSNSALHGRTVSDFTSLLAPRKENKEEHIDACNDFQQQKRNRIEG